MNIDFTTYKQKQAELYNEIVNLYERIEQNIGGYYHIVKDTEEYYLKADIINPIGNPIIDINISGNGVMFSLNDKKRVSAYIGTFTINNILFNNTIKTEDDPIINACTLVDVQNALQEATQLIKI
jgi:hypothetical protein